MPTVMRLRAQALLAPPCSVNKHATDLSAPTQTPKHQLVNRPCLVVLHLAPLFSATDNRQHANSCVACTCQYCSRQGVVGRPSILHAGPQQIQVIHTAIHTASPGLYTGPHQLCPHNHMLGCDVRASQLVLQHHQPVHNPFKPSCSRLC